MKKEYCIPLALVASLVLMSAPAQAEDDAIESAKSAAPASISAEARILQNPES